MTVQRKPLSAMSFTLEDLERTFGAARQAILNAYCPYSNLSVGCGILCHDGSLFRGCNMETASHDATHAEEAALSAMVTAGRRDPQLIVTLGSLDKHRVGLVAACGKCRQVIHEFGSLQQSRIWTLVACALDNPAKTALFLSDTDLLPLHFGPADIGVDLPRHRRP